MNSDLLQSVNGIRIGAESVECLSQLWDLSSALSSRASQLTAAVCRRLSLHSPLFYREIIFMAFL